jgi:hypothetical protein
MSYLPCLRSFIVKLVEGFHEPVAGGVDSVQPVGISEMTVCRMNLFILLQSCQPSFVR